MVLFLKFLISPTKKKKFTMPSKRQAVAILMALKPLFYFEIKPLSRFKYFNNFSCFPVELSVGPDRQFVSPSLSPSAGTESVEYKGNSWHDECFTCCSCKRPIGSQSFLSKGSDVHCSPCYDKKFAKHCVSCKKVCLSLQTGARHTFLRRVQELNMNNLKGIRYTFSGRVVIFNSSIKIKGG